MFTLFWQVPHFYALSIMYLDDYKQAGFKMLPIGDEGFVATKRQVLVFTFLMILSSVYPYFILFLSDVYFFGVLILSVIFVRYTLKFTRDLSIQNARKLFFLSIIYLMAWFLLIILDILMSLN